MIRKDLDRQKLKLLLLDGAASPVTGPVNDAYFESLRARFAVTAKPVIPRAIARRDVEEAIDFYANDAGEAVALRFVDALRNAYRVTSTRPAAGSPR